MPDISDIIKDTLDGIKCFADSDAIIGKQICTPNGVTIIPISKMTVGFLGGGLDYGQKKIAQGQNLGRGSGTGISITPIAFLTVTSDSTINLIPINGEKTATERIFSIIERSPEILDKIKNTLL